MHVCWFLFLTLPLPCGGQPIPDYPSLEQAPVVRVWDRVDWTPPSCTGWKPAEASTLVVTTARFRNPAGVDGLRRRVGAVSTLKGLPYWSTSNGRWQPLIVDAYALSGPAAEQRRKDFAVDEIAAGRTVYLLQEDNLAGKAVYRMEIVSASPERLVFRTENHAVIRYLGLPILAAGEIQSLTFLDRDADGVWRYYSIARTGKGASLLTGGHEASIINRAVASFRYLAGIPADQEPPAAKSASARPAQHAPIGELSGPAFSVGRRQFSDLEFGGGSLDVGHGVSEKPAVVVGA